MRTTLDIDDDVLTAAKELAAVKGVSAGRMLSDLARRGLAPAEGAPQARSRNGVPVLPPRESGRSPVTMRQVNALRDDA